MRLAHEDADPRDHVLHANTTLVDRVDLATPLSLSSQPATGLSALAPAQRAEAQRLCALAQTVKLRRSDECRLPGGRPERPVITAEVGERQHNNGKASR